MKHKSLLSAKDQQRAKKAFKDQEDYEDQLEVLQKQMLDLQQKLRREKRSALIIFEGADAAGKGGVIKRMTKYLDPRGFQVHGISAPNVIEAKQNYMQRFFSRLPSEGSIVIFDRSWYGRVLVERVEGFAAKKDGKRAYDEINAIEKMIVDDGVLVFKFCLDLSFEEQAKRFEERKQDPLKKWKLTEDDWRNRKKWDKYTEAFTAMIDLTSTKHAPWKVVAADSKWFSRVSVLKEIVKRASKALS